jgi:hypothetical protein
LCHSCGIKHRQQKGLIKSLTMKAHDTRWICKALFFYKLFKMEILRTDGGGSYREDERLKSLRKILNVIRSYKIHYDENKILKLHDHKGLLSVYWQLEPDDDQKNLLKYLWIQFGEYEIEHFFTVNDYVKC